MEAIKKTLKVITTIIPNTTVRVDNQRGKGYVVIMERTWFGITKTIEIRAKDAVDTGIDLLELF